MGGGRVGELGFDPVWLVGWEGGWGGLEKGCGWVGFGCGMVGLGWACLFWLGLVVLGWVWEFGALESRHHLSP